MDVRAAAFIDRIASFEDEPLRAEHRAADPPPKAETEIEAEFEEVPMACFTTGFLAHLLGQVMVDPPATVSAARAYPARRPLRPGISFNLTA